MYSLVPTISLMIHETGRYRSDAMGWDGMYLGGKMFSQHHGIRDGTPSSIIILPNSYKQ